MKNNLRRFHYVDFIGSNGKNTDTLRRVRSRDPHKLRLSSEVRGFEFCSRVEGYVAYDEIKIPVQSGFIDRSGWYYVGGSVYSLDELPEQHPGLNPHSLNHFQQEGINRFVLWDEGKSYAKFLPFREKDSLFIPGTVPDLDAIRANDYERGVLVLSTRARYGGVYREAYRIDTFRQDGYATTLRVEPYKWLVNSDITWSESITADSVWRVKEVITRTTRRFSCLFDQRDDGVLYQYGSDWDGRDFDFHVYPAAHPVSTAMFAEEEA